jgi:hypothetical protein
MYKKLHKTVYYVLVNLSFSDVMLLMTILVQNTYSRHNAYLKVAHTAFYTASILSTFGITIDRYVAVVYCLRYREFVTNNRLLVSLLLLWISSIVLAIIPSLITSNLKWRELYTDCIHVPLYLLCSVCLVLTSLWIRRIRNKHVEAIKKRNVYFGIESERLSTLQNLSASVLEIIKLNFMTAVLVIFGNILGVVFNYYLDEPKNFAMLVVLHVVRILYVLSNPIVYMLTMTDLRKRYSKILNCKSVNSNAVSDSNE